MNDAGELQSLRFEARVKKSLVARSEALCADFFQAEKLSVRDVRAALEQRLSWVPSKGEKKKGALLSLDGRGDGDNAAAMAVRVTVLPKGGSGGEKKRMRVPLQPSAEGAAVRALIAGHVELMGEISLLKKALANYEEVERGRKGWFWVINFLLFAFPLLCMVLFIRCADC